jgi:cell division transport system permease protein
MKLTTVKQSIKEGFVNIVRHPLVTIASITTISLMLVLIGTFIIFSANANKIATSASQQPPILLWMEYETTAEEVTAVDEKLKVNEKVKTYQMQTPEDNFTQFKEDLGENSQVLDGFDATLLPYTFTIQLNDTAMIEDFKAEMEGMLGVRKVEYSQPVTEFLNKARGTVNIATLIAFIVLCGIALFIISNMVRIAVFSRAEEIGIMKYVGATNWYIRVPYIIEGSVVGLVGAVIANLVVLVAYQLLFKNMLDGQTLISFIQMVPLSELTKEVITINTVLGVVVGGGGSALAVRRHIKV